MKYFIKITYRTGDSFGSEIVSELLDSGYNKLSVAEENLERIKNHYEDYLNYNNSSKMTEPLNLVIDSGDEYSIHPFWCGYFESLIRAEITRYFKKYEPYSF